MTKLSVSIKARRSEEERCVYCHSEDDTRDTDGEIVNCTGCGALMHVECRVETPRCPTFGCRFRTAPGTAPAGPVLAPAPAPPIAVYASRPSRAWSWPAVIAVLACFAIGVSFAVAYVGHYFGLGITGVVVLASLVGGLPGGALGAWLRHR